MDVKEQKNDTTPVNFKVGKGCSHTHAGKDYSEGDVIKGMMKFKADKLVKQERGTIVASTVNG